MEYTYVDQNHHYIVKCTNRNKDCIQNQHGKCFSVIRPIVISE